MLAALPAHLAAELGMEWPALLVLVLFVTNCSEALIAAAGVRWFSDAPGRFDTLRPGHGVHRGRRPRRAVSVVVRRRGGGGGGAGRAVLARLANALFLERLTELMLGPAIIMAVAADRPGSAARRAGGASRRRCWPSPS